MEKCDVDVINLERLNWVLSAQQTEVPFERRVFLEEHDGFLYWSGVGSRQFKEKCTYATLYETSVDYFVNDLQCKYSQAKAGK